MQKTIITKINRSNIDKDIATHDSKVNAFCEGKKIFGTLTSLVDGSNESGVLYKSDTICFEGNSMFNETITSKLPKQTLTGVEIRDRSVGMVPCPKCKKPIHPKFTYHGDCGWKKGQEIQATPPETVPSINEVVEEFIDEVVSANGYQEERL